MKKYLHFDWHTLSGEFLQTEFEALGFLSVVVDHPINYTNTPENMQKEERVLQKIKETLKNGGIEFVFSFNYFSALGRICHELGVKYLSCVYDSPWPHLENDTILFDTNFIFSFDSYICEQAKRRGANTFYYLPLFSHPLFYDSLKLTAEAKKKYQADIAFVGSLHELSSVRKFKEGINSAYFSGYVDGIINAQKGVYGIDLIGGGYSAEFLAYLDRLDEQGFFPRTRIMGLHKMSFKDMIYNHILREIAYLERFEIVEELSKSFNFKLYTKTPKEYLPDTAQSMGWVDTYFEAPLVYRLSLVNINLTVHGIRTGIPLRCFDVMAAGGFLMSNYQRDFDFHFIDGTDYVSFSEAEELYELARFYLAHESQRVSIAKAGYEKVKKYHTSRHRAIEMLATAGIMP